MIKHTEINVGDWVRVNDVDYPMPLIVSEIVKLGDSYYLRLGRDDDATISLECEIGKVLPIHLTEPILMKNDFDKVDDNTFIFYDDNMNNVIVSLFDPLHHFPVADISAGMVTVSQVPVAFVHELQREVKRKIKIKIRL